MAIANNNVITKSQLIAQITKKLSNCSEKDVELGINKILDYIADCLSQGKRIEIRGFGSFCPRYRKARQAHNPRTGEKVETKAKYVPCFRAGKELRDRVNK
jgi:integration host factor subunit beta